MYRRPACFIGVVLFLALAGRASADLIGWWTFDEGTGTVAADSSGKGHTGTLQGNPEWVEGKRGSSALSFDGVNDIVQVNEDSSFLRGHDFTVEIKHVALRPDNVRRVDKQNVVFPQPLEKVRLDVLDRPAQQTDVPAQVLQQRAFKRLDAPVLASVPAARGAIGFQGPTDQQC